MTSSRRRTLNRLLVLSIVAIATILIRPVTVVEATLTVPTPLYFWDLGNDGSPDAGAYTIRTAGLDSLWTSAREARITSAVAEWNGDTQWNPSVNLTAAPADCFLSLTCQGVWIDGSHGGVPFVQGELAHNVFLPINRVDAEGTPYKDMEDADIFFNTAAPGHPTWTYSSAGSSSDTIYDFQGILTHEVGHSIFLFDLGLPGYPACAPGGTLETMCGYVYKGWQSTQQRTLVPDDITSANIVY